MNKMLKKRIMIVVYVVSILVTSRLSFLAFGDHPKIPHIFGRVWTYMLEPCCGWFYGCSLTGI